MYSAFSAQIYKHTYIDVYMLMCIYSPPITSPFPSSLSSFLPSRSLNYLSIPPRKGQRQRRGLRAASPRAGQKRHSRPLLRSPRRLYVPPGRHSRADQKRHSRLLLRSPRRLYVPPPLLLLFLTTRLSIYIYKCIDMIDR